MEKTTSKEEGDEVTGYFGVGRAGCVSAVLALVAGARRNLYKRNLSEH